MKKYPTTSISFFREIESGAFTAGKGEKKNDEDNIKRGREKIWLFLGERERIAVKKLQLLKKKCNTMSHPGDSLPQD